MANQFCAGTAWSIECWANITTYTNGGSNGAYSGSTGARFIGNTTWTGGSTRKPRLDWGIMALSFNSVVNAPQKSLALFVAGAVLLLAACTVIYIEGDSNSIGDSGNHIGSVSLPDRNTRSGRR